MKEVDEPSVRLNYQTMKGDPEVEVEALYKWIEHAHVSPVARFKDPTEAVIRALLKRGYDGTVTVEFCTDSLPAEGETFDRAKAIAGMKKDVAFVKRLRAEGKASGE
jgi:sugar phosphate isomerase/epimerase